MPKLEEDLLKAIDEGDTIKVSECLKQGPNISDLVGSGHSILGRAAQMGRIEIIRELLQYNENTSKNKKCNVNSADCYARTALHYAAEQGKMEIVKLLLKIGSLIDVSDSDGVIPLHLAVKGGHEECVETLVQTGSQVNRKTREKLSALHIASSRGYANIVKILLKHGAKIEALDASERTPLLVAVIRGNHEVGQVLISQGAKVNIEEIHGYTPLAEAIWQNDVILVKMLLQAGAKLTKSHYLLHHCVISRKFELVNLLLRNGCLVNIRDESGNAPLHIAVSAAEFPIVELLINYGAYVNFPNLIQGTTPLHEAVNGIPDWDHVKFTNILRLLIQHNCRLDAESVTTGDTPLYRAIMADKFNIASSLIRHGADANRGHVFSCNIDNLQVAQRKGNFILVRLLVYSGFDVRNTHWLEIFPSNVPYNYSSDSIKGWLIYVKKNPLRLTDLCRKTVRQKLGNRVYPVVRTLLIPEKIKRFLLLEEID
uniref:SOCS box domain-containing protein n=1 Tax=Strigamia maritima TaxID=126957 RepID=T1J709_STRMM